MGRECINGLMEENMKANGEMEICTEKENMFSKIKKFMREIL